MFPYKYKGAQVDPRKRGSSYEYMQCRGKGKDSENDTVGGGTESFIDSSNEGEVLGPLRHMD